MNIPNRTTLLKMAVLVAVGLNSLTIPASAQNPRPTIFNEPPYNQGFEPRPGHKLHHGHHRPGQRSAQAKPLRHPPGDRRPEPGAPNDRPQLRRPPSNGFAPTPLEVPPANRP